MECLSAMIGFMEDMSVEENYEAMVDTISEVNTGLVTVAVRDTTVNGIEIKNGNYIGIEMMKLLLLMKIFRQQLKILLIK